MKLAVKTVTLNTQLLIPDVLLTGKVDRWVGGGIRTVQVWVGASHETFWVGPQDLRADNGELLEPEWLEERLIYASVLEAEQALPTVG